MKANLLTHLRGFLLAGTVLAGLSTVAGTCHSPYDGNGSMVWDCTCSCGGQTGPTTIWKVCGDNSTQALQNCDAECTSNNCGYYSIGTMGSYGPGCGGPGSEAWSGPGPQSSEATLTSDSSFATMSLWGQPASVQVGGDVSFTGGCEDGACSIGFAHLYLEPGDFAFRGPDGSDMRVSHVQIVNSGVIAGTVTDGVFTIPSEQVSLLVDGVVNDESKSVLITLNSGQDFSGYYVPSSGEFGITARFSAAGGALELALDLRGTATARPPVADAGHPQTAVADHDHGTARVTLDGSGSVDYDDDLVEIDWYEGEHLLGSGTFLDVELGVGTHTLTAVARDATQKHDTAETTVTVTAE